MKPLNYRKLAIAKQAKRRAGKDANLKRNYGVTLEQHEEMLRSQGYRCAICGSDDPFNKLGWQTDHDHTSGMVRGILCRKCNLLLGFAGDDIERLMQAVAYLRRFM